MKRLYLFDDLARWAPSVAGAAAVLLSIAFAASFFARWSCPYICDDGGIVVKYMDCFAEGAFYSYNVEDGPVFGISGFLHGILSGAFAYTHLFSPQNSVLASNCLGVCLTSLAVLLILRVFSNSCSVVVLAWAATLTASTFFVQTAFQGLETPLHLAVVLLTFWAFLSDSGRTMWLLGALAVISKLDAVPIVGILGVMRMVRVFDRTRPVMSVLEELRSALLWAGVPTAVWLLFTYTVFGSPLPQTAYVKLHFRTHPLDRFAFLAPWWAAHSYRMVAYAGVYIVFVAGCLFLRRNFAGKCSIFMVGLLGELVLYCAYNPGERMSWYYVLPQTLLVLGAVTALISVPWFASQKTSAVMRLAVCLVLLAFLPFSLSSAKFSARQTISYICSTEPERIAVGEWIRSAASPGDRLSAAHGHIARYARLYTYDFSGLNSPVVTNLWRQGKSPLQELRPEWIARHGILSLEEQKKLRYELAASFYGISLTGWPVWRVWRREEQDSSCSPCMVCELSSKDVATNGRIEHKDETMLHIHGSHIVLRSPELTATPEALLFGIAKRSEPFDLMVTCGPIHSEQPHENLESIRVPPRELKDLANGRTLSCHVRLPPIPPSSRVEIVLTQGPGERPPEPLQLLEPAWIMKSADAVETSNNSRDH